MPRHRLCFVVSSPMTVAAFLAPHISRVAKDCRVTVVANYDGKPPPPALLGVATFLDVPIERKVRLLRDLRAFFVLTSIFRRERFDLVSSVTPKAGLLAMLAARVACIPHRIHTFTGQVWVTRSGISRWFLKWADRCVALMASRVLVDSPSQREFLVSESIVADTKASVIADGSISGVNLTRFRPDSGARDALRRDLGIPADDVVVIYVGRLDRDKGVLDLAEAFACLDRKCTSRVRLLVVGPDEAGLTQLMRSRCAVAGDRVHFVGFTSAPQKHLAAADIFCLPSYREGFGSSIIEAAAVGLPSVASRIYGITDAVVDGETGLLHTPRDVGDLTAKLERLVEDAELRARMGEAARMRACSRFSEERVTEALAREYQDVLERGHKMQ